MCPRTVSCAMIFLSFTGLIYAEFYLRPAEECHVFQPPVWNPPVPFKRVLDGSDRAWVPPCGNPPGTVFFLLLFPNFVNTTQTNNYKLIRVASYNASKHSFMAVFSSLYNFNLCLFTPTYQLRRYLVY